MSRPRRRRQPSRGVVNLKEQVNVANHIWLSKCTIQLKRGDFCDAPTWPDAPFPICVRHLTMAYRAARERIEDLHRSDPMYARLIAIGGLDDSLGLSSSGRSSDADKKNWVYYLQVGPLLKIGHTDNLTKRMNAYPPNSRLLAYEDGGQPLEKQRLRQFKQYLSARLEWFTPGPELIEHINELRRKSGAKPINKFMPDVA